jgi:hypothetical protein
MLLELVRDNVRQRVKSGENGGRVFFEVAAQMMTAVVYLPLLFRPGKEIRPYSEMEKLIEGLHCKYHRIEEDKIYHDFVVHGVK